MRSTTLCHRELDEAINEIIETFEFELPVSFGDFKLGTLKIDFEYEKEKISREKRQRKVDLLSSLSWYIKESLLPLLKRVIEIRFRLEERYDEQIEKAVASEGTFTSIFFNKLYGSKWPISTLGAFLYKEENEIFELIKAEGPIILCDIDIQEKILEWLANKDIASVKMNKLKDSLLEYTYKSTIKDKLLKTGRPEAELIKRIGRNNIMSFYPWLKNLLNFIKKRKEYHRTTDNIYELIEQAGEHFFQDIKEKLGTKKEDVELFESIVWKGLIRNPFYPISVCLEENENLEAEFFRFEWEPNRFAKKILARLLDVSVSKIEKILYHKE